MLGVVFAGALGRQKKKGYLEFTASLEIPPSLENY